MARTEQAGPVASVEQAEQVAKAGLAGSKTTSAELQTTTLEKITITAGQTGLEIPMVEQVPPQLCRWS